MKIIIPSEFLLIVQDKYILLDTTVFIDTFINPQEFSKFFNDLRGSGVTLATLDLVEMEFTRGAVNEDKLQEKRELVNNIIDTRITVTPNIIDNVNQLIRKYKEQGKSTSTTDFVLGATLVNYPNNLLLMTRNTNDFPTDIFNLCTCFNIVHKRGIFAYGLYEYKK